MTIVDMHLRKMPDLTTAVRSPFCISTYFYVPDFSILKEILVGSFGFISNECHKDLGNIGALSQF